MKVLLVNLPYTYHKTYPLSVAYLASHLKAYGIECDILDLNIEFFTGEVYNKLGSNQYRYQEIKDNTARKAKFEKVLEKHLGTFNKYDIIGFSLLIDVCEVFLLEALDIIKPKNHVVVGGNYITYANTSKIQQYVPEHGICRGRGDVFFEELLGLDGSVAPYSYNQYINTDIEKYSKIDVLVSTGCIHRCPFCYNSERGRNAIVLRDTKYIIEELIYINETYKQKLTLLRADNIINSVKHFNKFISEMPKNKYLWYAQFALESFNKHKDSINWENIKPSGCSFLMLGVESFSEKVRHSLKSNKYTNEDIFSYLDTFKKYNISCMLHIILGYITETEEDFQEHLELSEYVFKNYRDIIVNVSVNPYRLYFEDTKSFEIQYDSKGNWIYDTNTAQSRMDKALRFRDLTERYRIRCSEVDINYQNILLPR